MPTSSVQGACPGIWVRLSLVEIYLTGITWSHFQRTVWTLDSNKGKESVMVTNDTSWYASELSEKLEVYPNCFTHQIGSLNNHEVDVKNSFRSKTTALHVHRVKSSQLYLGRLALSAIGWYQQEPCINYDYKTKDIMKPQNMIHYCPIGTRHVNYDNHLQPKLSLDANCSSFSLAESPPHDLQKLPTNNGLLMRNVVQLSLASEFGCK